jgi:superfamily II DNA/RNA helicase
MSLVNVINNASWSISDILFSTPVILSHILEQKQKQGSPLDINPKTIIIDEFDELLSNQQLQGHVFKILSKFAPLNDPAESGFEG